MAADNKLELVIQVDAGGANASIKSVNTSLSGLEKTAVSSAKGASTGEAGRLSSGMGTLLKTSALGGASVGMSVVVGTLSQAFGLSGQSVGESSGTAAFARISQLAGSALGASSGTGALVVFWRLSGNTVGVSSAIGDLSIVGSGGVIHGLMGTTVSVSMATGALSLVFPLDGAVSGNSGLLFYWAGIPRSRSVGVR